MKLAMWGACIGREFGDLFSCVSPFASWYGRCGASHTPTPTYTCISHLYNVASVHSLFPSTSQLCIPFHINQFEVWYATVTQLGTVGYKKYADGKSMEIKEVGIYM